MLAALVIDMNLKFILSLEEFKMYYTGLWMTFLFINLKKRALNKLFVKIWVFIMTKNS